MTDQQPGFRIELHPSLFIIRYLCVIHLAAFIALVWQSNSLLYVALGSALIVVGFVHGWSQYGVWHGTRSVRALKLRSDSFWMIEYGDGREEQVELLNSPLVSPWLVVLSFRAKPFRRHVLLLADNADPAALRRLRVRLRFQSQDA